MAMLEWEQEIKENMDLLVVEANLKMSIDALENSPSPMKETILERLNRDIELIRFLMMADFQENPYYNALSQNRPLGSADKTARIMVSLKLGFQIKSTK